MSSGLQFEGLKALSYAGQSDGTTLIGPPGLFPGAKTKKPEFTRDLHDDNLLGSAAILLTEAGQADVEASFIDVARVVRPDFLTTPTWNTLPPIFERVDPGHLAHAIGVRSVDPKRLAHTTTVRGVQLTYDAIEKSGVSNIGVLGSTRPPGDSVTNLGSPNTLSEQDSARRAFSEHIEALLEGADGRPITVGLETEASLVSARIFADLCEEEFEVDYTVGFRPAGDGTHLADGNTFEGIPNAVGGSRLKAVAFNCNWAYILTSALSEADRLGVKITWAAPNGFNDSPGHKGGSPGTRSRAETHQATLRELDVWRDLGVVVFDGCCGTIASELADYREHLLTSAA